MRGLVMGAIMQATASRGNTTPPRGGFGRFIPLNARLLICWTFSGVPVLGLEAIGNIAVISDICRMCNSCGDCHCDLLLLLLFPEGRRGQIGAGRRCEWPGGRKEGGVWPLTESVTRRSWPGSRTMIAKSVRFKPQVDRWIRSCHVILPN